MKCNNKTRVLKRSAIAASLTASLCLGFAAPLLAASSAQATTENETPSPTTAAASRAKPAEKCLTDLRAFDGQMQKDGYWQSGSGYGYGFPVHGYGSDELTTSGESSAPAATGYGRARPGYEVRMLIASATILAHRGQQQACEAVLSATRDVYKDYAADMRRTGMTKSDRSDWRSQQIASAQPVTGSNTPYRFDQLIGTDVVNPQGEALGSVEDIVHSPQSSKIAYLVLGRGGVFGIGEKYVPVPWGNFKATTGTNLLVLNTTKNQLDAAPQVEENQFSPDGDFGKQSQSVNDYWKTQASK